ncbi:NADPH-dependent 7-cyano-7-deazaguanine reductase QueF [Desulfogranum mediterraneum]|uniref:NADPH-dependent 7-cyano-7-deazaguanine reductase QueF n=1 Tax=Desulfogranum mediterraneum TaxID=160661 RepID=UPI0003F95553|nr:NADPH-dependent 7-cyano-7-deazaguanine reductase QueF [Desulfogranum mediterraneum]
MSSENPLGRQTDYPSSYDPGRLYPVKRSLGRAQLGLGEGKLPFLGEDIWTAWELSWLEPDGRPVSAVAELRFPASSPCIVESKSLKLYLNSFNMSHFQSRVQVQQIMTADLTRVAAGPVRVSIYECDDIASLETRKAAGHCIDQLSADHYVYSVEPTLLDHDEGWVEEETLHSHILRTNCPVTGQPDWATVEICYSGRKIEQRGLLAYLVSFRTHSGYHENCVETIFTDILHRLGPTALTVVGRFTRRGGLDINPCRSSTGQGFANHRLLRQ